MFLRTAFTSPLPLTFLSQVPRAFSAWAGSFALETPTFVKGHQTPKEEGDSQPSVSGWGTSRGYSLFDSRDESDRESGSFPELPDVSKPEGSQALGEAYRLMAVPKRKISPSRNGLRFQHKWLKPAFGLIKCRSCGRVMVRHKFCSCGLIAPAENEAPPGGQSTS